MHGAFHGEDVRMCTAPVCTTKFSNFLDYSCSTRVCTKFGMTQNLVLDTGTQVNRSNTCIHIVVTTQSAEIFPSL